METVQCNICGKKYDGESALAHYKLTNHNSWTLILPDKPEEEGKDVK